MKTSRCLSAALLGLLIAAPLQAAMYKWVDDQGNVVYSQNPPPDRSKAQVMAPPPPPPSKPYRPKLDSADTAQEGDGKADNGAPETEAPFKAEVESIRKKNCEFARKNLDIYRNFDRIRGPKGEVIVLDEATRAAKIKEAEGQIKDYCQ